jgi:hypothetical protein
MATQRRLSQKLTSVEDGLFHAVSNVHTVLCDVRPDLKNVALGEWRKSVKAHLLDERS